MIISLIPPSVQNFVKICSPEAYVKSKTSLCRQYNDFVTFCTFPSLPLSFSVPCKCLLELILNTGQHANICPVSGAWLLSRLHAFLCQQTAGHYRRLYIVIFRNYVMGCAPPPLLQLLLFYFSLAPARSIVVVTCEKYRQGRLSLSTDGDKCAMVNFGGID